MNARAAWAALAILAALFLAGFGLQYSPLFPPGAVRFPVGTVGNPSLTFVGDEDTGIYSPAANQVDVSIAGQAILRLHAAGLMAVVDNSFDLGTDAGSRFRHLHILGSVLPPVGSPSAPSYTFRGDTDTGVFSPAANQVGITAGGTAVVRLHAAGLAFALDGAYQIGTGQGSRPGHLHFTGGLVMHAHTLLIGDNGVSGTANGETVTPAHALIFMICHDGDGCPITLGETGIVPGQVVTFINLSGSASHTTTFSDTAGVSELAGAFVAGPNDVIDLIYGGSAWIERSRSNN